VHQGDLEDLARWLKALSEPNRLQLFDRIVEGYQCNCQLGDELGMSANLISHHLGVLRDAGLVESERDPLDARWVYYSVNVSALRALNDALGAFFDLDRIQPRRLTCGPQAVPAESDGLALRVDGGLA
jgi:ArsR family transcriptional regulator